MPARNDTGWCFRSQLEQRVAQDLKDRGVKGFEYEPDVILYEVPAQLRKYTPDIRLPNGIYVEIKGRWTATDRKKISLVIEQNPKLDLRMLFQRNHKISKSSKTRYADWCVKRGIKYHVGEEVPQEWLDE